MIPNNTSKFFHFTQAGFSKLPHPINAAISSTINWLLISEVSINHLSLLISNQLSSAALLSPRIKSHESYLCRPSISTTIRWHCTGEEPDSDAGPENFGPRSAGGAGIIPRLSPNLGSRLQTAHRKGKHCAGMLASLRPGLLTKLPTNSRENLGQEIVEQMLAVTCNSTAETLSCVHVNCFFKQHHKWVRQLKLIPQNWAAC